MNINDNKIEIKKGKNELELLSIYLQNAKELIEKINKSYDDTELVKNSHIINDIQKIVEDKLLNLS